MSKFLKLKISLFSVVEMWPFQFGGSYDTIIPVFAAVTGLFVTFILARIIVGDLDVPVKDLSKHHNWKSAKILAKTLHCSICESMMLSGFGFYCDCCGVCADQDCIKKADRRLPCKTNQTFSEKMEHHWVKGNLPLGALCNICGDDCSMDRGLVDFQCCWCHRCVHTGCLIKESGYCDLGPFKQLIVPPWCLQISRRKSSVRRHLMVNSVKDPNFSDWTPLIVVGNRKSGNGDGDLILSEFRRMLHPAQVLDLSERTPEAALKWCVMIAPRTCKILACGGDGTVSWINNTVHKMQLDPAPSVGIIPLGTGNDLSRVLGWGGHLNACELDTTSCLQKVLEAESTNLDRWKVDVHNYSRKLGLRRSKMIYMYNYFSIGVDAQVAFDFHRTRESKFYVFKNRIFNKLLYLCFGTQQVMIPDYKNLEDRLELYLDEKKIELPEIEAIVVVNIPSWGAGVNLWELSDASAEQSISDGKLEVIGISSSFQMAQLQMGLSQPYCLGQAKKVEVRLLSQAAVQVDGEPWLQGPSTINITLSSPANVLQCKE